MYSDQDLDLAIKNKILKADDVVAFRSFIKSETTDEENFKLITSFNDIFITVASILLLCSLAFLIWVSSPDIAVLSVALCSWLLAEYFTRKKRMALPSIFLSQVFIASVFVFAWRPLSSLSMEACSLIPPFAISAISAYIHWKRFHTPITVATGIVAAVAAGLSALFCLIPAIIEYRNIIVFCIGLILFAFAMRWDLKDLKRIGISSDVAFWLHLFSSPLIIYPIFNTIIPSQGEIGIMHSVIFISAYLVISVISLVIDRRSLMLAGLCYILYGFNELLRQFGIIEFSYALAGGSIGSFLILLSIFWKKVRYIFIGLLPTSLQKKLPAVS